MIGTAGHVDHGKTTLVHALTGVDTDRLPEEKKRGITIELGFAPLQLDDATEASIVDVPGHRRLVHTMIAGATGIELVLVVVAADEGVMPQTREHLAACELLGIRRAVAAITMLDRAGSELAALAASEVTELLAGRFEAEVVVCSARSGEGIPELRSALSRALATLPPPPVSAAAHLAVDRIFSVKGAGTVVTGTLVRGQLEVGQPLRLLGAATPLETSARGLHIHDRAVPIAVAPTRLAVNLGRLAVEDVERGFVVSTDADVAPTRVLDVALRMLTPQKAGTTVEVYVGTARTTARFRPIAPAVSADRAVLDRPNEPPTSPNSALQEETTLARLSLARAIVATGGDRLVVRASSARGPGGAVVGGGRVLDAHPPALRRRTLRVEALRSVERGDSPAAIRALCAEAAPRSLPKAALGGRFPLTRAELARAAEKLVEKGELVRIKPEAWAPRASLVAMAAQARSLVNAHHEAHPLERGLAIETLRQKLGAKSDAGVAEEAIRHASRPHTDDALVVAGEIVCSARFGTAAPSAVTSVIDAARVALATAALKGLTEHQLGVVTALATRELRTLATRLVREGHAVTAGDLWFETRAISALRALVTAELASAKVLTIARFKDLSGLGRKQAIPLLELFDREGTTRRVGDDRIAGALAR